MLRESNKMLKRSSNKNIGLSFGYLYPQRGYDNSDRSFALDLRIEYELETYAVGMLLGARKGFAMNIYSSYFLTKTDFSHLLVALLASIGCHMIFLIGIMEMTKMKMVLNLQHGLALGRFVPTIFKYY